MIMLSRDEIKQYVEKVLLIKVFKTRKHAVEYVSQNKTFYIKKAEVHPFVIRPDWRDILLISPIDGVWPEENYYKNTNLAKFPALDPKSKSQCGCDVEVRDVEALEALLVRIGVIQAPEPHRATALADIEAAASQLAALPETEREAVITARIGQGLFRTALMSAWSNHCAVTGTNIKDLLRASHIKPWRDSNNGERLNAENGLLLVATLDAAFDAGLISFEDDGIMLFSPRLGPNPGETLCISEGSVLTKTPSPEQKTFLDHHRKAVFR